MVSVKRSKKRSKNKLGRRSVAKRVNRSQLRGLSRLVTEVTHNHEEGLKGAEVVAMSVFMVKKLASSMRLAKGK